MNCPKCDTYTPDGSMKCDRCGHLFSEEAQRTPYLHPRGSQASLRARNKSLFAGSAIILVLLLAIFLMKNSEDQGTYPSGSFVPGQRYDISRLVEADQITIIDFYSQYCPPCRQISPLLDQLDEKRDDIVVKRVDINRRGVRGIDWKSPLARQYNIRFVPYFMIFNQAGNITHKGRPATREIARLFQQEKISLR